MNRIRKAPTSGRTMVHAMEPNLGDPWKDDYRGEKDRRTPPDVPPWLGWGIILSLMMIFAMVIATAYLSFT